MKATAAVAIWCGLLASSLYGQEKVSASFTRGSGGSIQTKLGAGIVLNKESTLEREWLTLHDPALPADLVGTVGVKTVYQPDRLRGEYHYNAEVQVKPREALKAIEVRFLVFDLWGGHVRNLALDEIADMPAGVERPLSGAWRVYSENEVSRHYASIAYISRVRTADGRVVEADVAPVIQEAKKFSRKFTAADLEPKPEPKP